ncbi:hypothetical protein C8J57DRAFT_1098259, partial [Mycena rebaudengoi]
MAVNVPLIPDVFSGDDIAATADQGASTSPREKIGQLKIGKFFKVATQQEKEVHYARQAEERKAAYEAWEARDVFAKFEAGAKKTEDARLRKQKSRAIIRSAKIEAGWVPGAAGRKRVCERVNVEYFSNALLLQKFLELEEFDETPKASSSKIAEDSRPRRQFKEDLKKNNTTFGHKQLPKNTKTDAKQVNWRNPLIFAQLQVAAKKAGKPWRPSEICRQAKLLAPEVFRTLTEQVVGRWIDKEAKERGEHKWKDSVLEQVATGAAPGGQSTRAGILESYPALCSKIRRHLEALR